MYEHLALKFGIGGIIFDVLPEFRCLYRSKKEAFGDTGYNF